MVESSVSLSTGGNANRISGWDVLGISSSAYELETSDSQSNWKEENADRIFPVTEQEVMEKRFIPILSAGARKYGNLTG